MTTANSGKIRIIYVDDVFDFGGGEKHLLSLIDSLDSSRYEISVACREGSLLSENVNSRGLKVVCIKFRNKFDALGLFLFYRTLVKNRYDIVHLQDNRSHWIGAIAAKMARVPILIATVHMVNILRREDPSDFTVFLLKIADRIWSSMVDSIITVSESNRVALIEEKISDKKIKVIYNGVEPITPDPVKVETLKKECGIGGDDIVIGTVSRLSPQKGLEYLVAAAYELINNGKNVCFVIVGDGPDSKKLALQVEKLNINNRIKFLGFKHNPMDYMAFFDIFVLPSIYEGLPIAIIEAISLSIPVIASNVAGVPELVYNAKNGFLVTPKDVEGLVVAIEKLVSEKDVRHAMGQEGRRIYQEKFSLDQMVRKTEDLYKVFLNKKR